MFNLEIRATGPCWFAVLLLITLSCFTVTASASIGTESTAKPAIPETLINKADQGDAEAQYRLGNAYAESRRVKQNYWLAKKYWQLAASQDHLGAMFNLGIMFRDGIGTNKDYNEAETYLQNAAASGHVRSQAALGDLHAFTKDRIDYAKALHWYTQAAKNGFAPAQFNLGVLYEEGKGTKQDFVKAMQWYGPAGERGHAASQFRIARFYEEGKGTQKDYPRAMMWYYLSAKGGYPQARKAMTRIRPQVNKADLQAMVQRIRNLGNTLMQADPKLSGAGKYPTP